MPSSAGTRYFSENLFIPPLRVWLQYIALRAEKFD